MRIPTLMLTAAILLGGCGERNGPEANVDRADQPTDPAAAREAGWNLQSSGEGVGMALIGDAGATAIRLFCPANENRLLVNVPSFKPIGSEDRLSFGSGGQVVALVADPRGDAQRGGVTGAGRVPGNLAALTSGPISASYGAQSSGPHPVPPIHLARAFVAACSPDAAKPVPPPRPSSACLTQDDKPVPANRLRAIGTEPFWGARIEGRCVTYSHPEDQRGTRVWTRFSGTASNGSWSGALGGSPFVLRTRAQAGCSDGMSDNRYPIAVTLTVGGEQRTGCAEPL